MASDTKNVKLGVCKVTFDGVDLGYTKGGVEVEVATETHKVEVDQFGKSPINEIIMGRSVSAKVPLAETTLENMVRIMPGATLVSDGVAATGTITFATAAPSADDNVTVRGVVFTFKTSPVSENEVAPGASFTAAATNLRIAMRAHSSPLIRALEVTSNLGVVTITAKELGTAGNAFTLAKTGTNITVSGATLTSGAEPTSQRVDVTHGIGVSLLALARELVLHPIANEDDDLSEDFVIPLAATAGAVQFAYKLEDERIYNTSFMGYPDPTTKRLYFFGDRLAA